MTAARGAPALETRLSSGAFVVTAEITPPLAADADGLVAAARALSRRVDGINVTDGAGARVTMSSLAAAAILRAAGHEPVLQLTCRDRNRIALAGDLIGAAALGVRNLLILRGDDPAKGDMPEATPVHDLDSRGVMRLAREMSEHGRLPSGRAIEPAPRFFIGAADTPFDPPADWRPDGLAAKADAGARFVQTQFCFDPHMARRYLARLADAGLAERLCFLIGIGPLASARSARWMRERLFGVAIPDEVVDRLEHAADPAAEGRLICAELIQAYREMPGVAGVHLMAPRGGAEAIARVLDKAGLGERPLDL